MVFEVQENSDTTFRLYDWDHVDPNTHKKRDLQVDKALACVDFGQGEIEPATPAVETTAPVRREQYFDNKHFELWRTQGAIPFDVGVMNQPRVLVCVDGEGHVECAGEDFAMMRGAVMLLPASVGACRFRPAASATILEIAIPEAA